ncbi:NAD(+)/NADH kinase [Patescibacteria group bacterium]
MVEADRKKIYVFGSEGLTEDSKDPHYNEAWRIRNYLDKYAIRVDSPEQADLILVIGGDGKMLEAIRILWEINKPFCGLNFGHVGFLLNEPEHPTNVLNEVSDDNVQIIETRLLTAELIDEDGDSIEKVHAFNDIVIERTEPQAAKIKVMLDNEDILKPLICDGIIIATPPGSTGHNAAAGGNILPITSNNVVMTGISPALFHRWKSSILPDTSMIELIPEERHKRPVRLIADGQKLKDCHKVRVSISDQTVKLIFVNSQDFRSKVLRYQFNL